MPFDGIFFQLKHLMRNAEIEIGQGNNATRLLSLTVTKSFCFIIMVMLLSKQTFLMIGLHLLLGERMEDSSSGKIQFI